MLNRVSIERLRTPDELTAFVRQVVAYGNRTSDVLHAALQKKGLYKEFVDELVPLSAFSRLFDWGRDVRVGLVLGNQQYDAVVIDCCGHELTRIEIAFPHNGSEASSQARNVVKRGFSDLHIYDPTKDIAALSEICIRTAEKKSHITYKNCFLVFYLDYMPPDDDLKPAYSKQVYALVERLEHFDYFARRVFVIDAPAKQLWELGFPYGRQLYRLLRKYIKTANSDWLAK